MKNEIKNYCEIENHGDAVNYNEDYKYVRCVKLVWCVMQVQIDNIYVLWNGQKGRRKRFDKMNDDDWVPVHQTTKQCNSMRSRSWNE